jgi:hypothetical protein
MEDWRTMEFGLRRATMEHVNLLKLRVASSISGSLPNFTVTPLPFFLMVSLFATEDVSEQAPRSIASIVISTFFFF